MLKISTGLQNHLLVTGDLEAAMNGGVIRMYGSPTSQAAADALIPATADAAIGSATLLCTISNNGAGTGINLDTVAANGVIGKATAETWLGTMAATGYFSFYRFSAIADAGGLSTSEKRIQGTVGTVGKDLIVANAYKAISEEQRVDQYYLGMPAE